MAITVKHTKVSTIPDGSDTDLVRPSDWNADHTLTGLGTMAEQNANNVAITGGSVNGTSLGASTAASAKVTTLDIGSGLTLATNAGSAGQVLTSAGAGNVPTWTSNGAGDVVGPSSSTDNAVARFDTTTGKLIQNSVVVVDDNGNTSGVRSVTYSGVVPTSTPAGTMWYDSSTYGLNFQQNNITQQIGEEIFVYGKASAAITEGQLIVKTGVVGASGVITFGPSPTGLTDNDGIIGVATENIPLNGFGRITTFGVVHNINTSGSSVGETWADNDTLYYNPSYAGGLTKVKPTAPNIKFQVAVVINAAGGGAGSLQILLQPGSQLGGTDSNVQLSSPTGGQLLSYSSADSYWKNTNLAAGTGISVNSATNGVITVTNSAPDQTVAFTNGTGISVTGTYPNFTITNTSPSSGGTVTSVTGTSPISVTNGTTTPAISLGTVPIANGGTNGTATPTAGAVPYGTGTAYAFTSAGSSGQVLTSNGTSAPTWTNKTTYLGVLLNAGTTTQVPTSNGYIGIVLNSGSTTQVPIS